MKNIHKNIHPELRLFGRIIRLINPTFTKRRFHLFYRFTRIRLLKPRSRYFDFRYEYLMRGDGSQLRVCVYTPKGLTASLPGVLWLHGGGYAIGAPELVGGFVIKLMKASPCVVIAPDYRLSIQAPYPAALEDAHQTLLWMKENSQLLRIQSQQLIVGGESAGGGLAIALSLYARDQQSVKIAFMIPLYPMIDDRMMTPSSQLKQAPVWNSLSNYNAWKLYLGELFMQEEVPIYAAPARNLNYAMLPPTISFVGNLEPFLDENSTFMDQLQEANVPVYFRIFKGAYHGFDVLCPRSSIAKEATQFLQQSFQEALRLFFVEQDNESNKAH